MYQFISLEPLENDQAMLRIGLPTLNLELIPSLKANDSLSHTVAGFSKDSRGGFCFVTQQSFLKNTTTELAIQDVKKLNT